MKQIFQSYFFANLWCGLHHQLRLDRFTWRHKSGALEVLQLREVIMRKKIKFYTQASLRRETLKEPGSRAKSGRWCSLNDKPEPQSLASVTQITKNSLKKQPKTFQKKMPKPKVYM